MRALEVSVLCSFVLGCRTAPAAVVDIPSEGALEAAEASGACELLPTSLSWHSVYGASIAVPAAWEEASDITFTMGEQRFLSWGASEPFDPLPRIEEMLRKLNEGYPEAQYAGVASVKTPAGVAHYIIPGIVTGGWIAYAVIAHEPHPILLRLRGTHDEVRRMPALLGSLQPFEEGGPPLSTGRYRIHDLSFAWEVPLQLPSYFSFNATQEPRLTLEWLAAPAPFAETQWTTKFSFAEALGVPVTSERRIQSGRFCATVGGAPPPPPSVSTLERVMEVKNYDGERLVLVHAQARATFGSRTLSLDYYDARQRLDGSDEFGMIAASLVAERTELALHGEVTAQ